MEGAQNGRAETKAQDGKNGETKVVDGGVGNENGSSATYKRNVKEVRCCWRIDLARLRPQQKFEKSRLKRFTKESKIS